MSDFDAEAERKRLREKYEADEENRKRTQQMSELLLKGATMTNRHCGECGSPIFRYEDQEFCPSCQQTMGEAAEEGTESTASESADTTDAAGAARAETGAAAADTGADAEPETPGTGDVAASNGVTVDTGADPAADASTAADSSDVAAEPRGGTDGPTPTRGAARESLLAALTRHARLAADTDEPRRATDHLEAARTAAAALDELDGS